MFFNLGFFIFILCFLIFFRVRSIFFLIYFFEVLRLLRALLFFFLKNNSILLRYLFLSFLVIEAAIGFSFLVIFTRLLGRDQLFKSF